MEEHLPWLHDDLHINSQKSSPMPSTYPDSAILVFSKKEIIQYDMLDHGSSLFIVTTRFDGLDISLDKIYHIRIIGGHTWFSGRLIEYNINCSIENIQYSMVLKKLEAYDG